MDEIYIICFGFVFIFTSGIPATHQTLRSPKSYNAFLVLAVFLALIFLLTVIYELPRQEKVLSLTVFGPVTFMLFYKLFDKIIVKIYKRNLYFTRKHPVDDEGQESRFLDLVFQVLLFLIPFFWLYLGKLIFTEH